MKMRLLEVVSSSVRRMHDSTDQLTASVVSRCCTDTTHTHSVISISQGLNQPTNNFIFLHFITYSLGCGASCDSSDVLA